VVLGGVAQRSLLLRMKNESSCELDDTMMYWRLIGNDVSHDTGGCFSYSSYTMHA